MDKGHLNEKYANFRDVNGNKLRLYMNEVSTCKQISILSDQRGLYKQSIFLFATAIIALVLLEYNLVRIELIVGILFFTIICSYSICTATIEESLLIVEGLGIEINKRNAISTKKLFLPKERIKMIFINEVILRRKILFILTILLRDVDCDKLIPLFIETLPELKLLKNVLNYVQYKKSEVIE
ncbi:unnamed protein product [Phyllotreta striolata]|uniref:Phosphatidylinositol N-acetylglucosaminyltransferase subunit H conserved domain-containing protein n=1 Tax=Phyllotreta striolata TaxID=444603 RepID=A0A9N9TXK6_PHYSR|nr:unnamed protein product [Phyllotreta striolata]